MPTFTAIALDGLLEPGAKKSTAKPPPSKLERRNQSTDNKPYRSYASPTLYTTPKTTPLPDSPSSFPPSPYIVNHKRRGPRLLESCSQNDVAECRQPNVDENIDKNGAEREKVSNLSVDVSCIGTVSAPREKVLANGFHDRNPKENKSGGGLVGADDSAKSLAIDSEKDCECEDFFDPQDSVSVASNTETEDNNGIECSGKNNMLLAEYFDAYEELSAEGTPHSSLRDVEAELREIRVNFLMEIERRKQVEEAFDKIQNQWQRIGQQLSLVGLTLPPASTITAEKDEEFDVDPAEELHRQVVLARVVANSIGRGCAKAEVELEMESQIESKNNEITRLWDRLHYYEVVNREMSQRNQEAVEMARRQRRRRKRRQRLVWSSVGLAITLGSAAIAWSYLPSLRGSSITSPSDAPGGDGDSANHEHV
ncbi:bacteriophage N4 adsorption B protein [Tasmannia lanceolata]|uniref:bacteriophage N4 adsorption B protein n=1 Tax=Tasmannia lanceolata TaxID=3420 RepID=UPI00406288F7